jgi:16S rRNA (guanine966-N2)-methyltransferase
MRIVAGSMRGRKVTFTVQPNLRPTPQMVREALFSILGNAVPGRPFIDVFAGTGIVGMEAVSRGARFTLFVERDFRLIEELENHRTTFGVRQVTQIARNDAYRWIEHWTAPPEPATIFLSPPFADLEKRPADLLALIQALQQKVAVDSVIVLQAEMSPMLNDLPALAEWDARKYGRNFLYFWVKESQPTPEPETTSPS